MTILLSILLFLLGLTLAGQVIAALYSVIDLAYGLPASLFRILARLLPWYGGTFLVTWFLGPLYGPPFLWGLAAGAVVFVIGFVVFNLKIRRFLRRGSS